MNTQDTYSSFMLDHAAGNHADAFALAADLHLKLSPEGAETAWLWSVIGGALLEKGPGASGVPVSDKWRRKPRGKPETAGSLLAMARTDLPWRRGLSGVAFAPTATRGAKFMRLDPGQAAPMHGHSAIEATVVLQGRFSDGHGVYSRGDLVLGEPGMRHKPAAVGDAPCICFVAEKCRPFWRPF